MCSGSWGIIFRRANRLAVVRQSAAELPRPLPSGMVLVSVRVPVKSFQQAWVWVKAWSKNCRKALSALGFLRP